MTPPSARPKITPFLWFDSNAEEAMNFYVSIFKNSRILNVMRYGDAGPGPKGTVMAATFQLEGQEFQALNGGPQYRFTPAISLFVNCESSAGGGHSVEQASGGREGGSVRMAHGQVRAIVANHSLHFRQAAAG